MMIRSPQTGRLYGIADSLSIRQFNDHWRECQARNWPLMVLEKGEGSKWAFRYDCLANDTHLARPATDADDPLFRLFDEFVAKRIPCADERKITGLVGLVAGIFYRLPSREHALELARGWLELYEQNRHEDRFMNELVAEVVGGLPPGHRRRCGCLARAEAKTQ